MKGFETQRKSAGSLALICSCPFLVSPSLAQLTERYARIDVQVQVTDHFARDANGKTVVKEWTINARVVTGVNEWRIDNDFSQNADITWLFDGTNVYRRSQIRAAGSTQATNMTAKPDQPAVPQIIKVPVSSEFAKSHDTITVTPSSDGQPIGDHGANIPWLAFCSATYLGRPGRLVPLPTADLPHAPDGFGYTDQTETFADELGLPRLVNLRTSRAMAKESAINFNKKYLYGRDLKRLEAWQPAIEDGLLKFRYEVLESTNFQGWIFPTKFQYVVNKRAGDGSWVPDYSGIGTVTAIGPSDKPQGIFVPGLYHQIVDHRFDDSANKIGGILYSTMDNYLAPVHDFFLQTKLAESVQHSAASRAREAQ